MMPGYSFGLFFRELMVWVIMTAQTFYILWFLTALVLNLLQPTRELVGRAYRRRVGVRASVGLMVERRARLG
jgi:hypothetical protein